MKSQNMLRLRSSRQYTSKKDRNGSFSPRLSTSFSEKCLWNQSFKNQPIPNNILKRVMLTHHKKYFDYDSQDQQDIMPVQQEDEIDIHEKKKSRLSKYKIMGDWDQFSERRNRIKSEKKSQISHDKRCHSVQSLKLPQVEEDGKQDDDLQRLQLSKLSQLKDQNQFNLKKPRRSSSSYTDVASKGKKSITSVQSLQYSSHYAGGYPELIPQMQAQQTKSVKLPNQKSSITVQLEKLIVDEIDDKKKKKEEFEQEIQCIEEQKHEQQIDVQKLRQSLDKFDTQYEYMKSHADEFVPTRKSDHKNNLNITEEQELNYHDQEN